MIHPHDTKKRNKPPKKTTVNFPLERLFASKRQSRYQGTKKIGIRGNQILLFNGRKGDEFPLWQLRVEPDLNKKGVRAEVAAVSEASAVPAASVKTPPLTTAKTLLAPRPSCRPRQTAPRSL